jgi:hypothetical protein
VFREPWTAPWDYERMIRDSFDVLYREGETHGRVMCVALHPFISGQPNKIGALRSALQYVASHDHVWLATGSEIIDAFKDYERRTLAGTSDAASAE